MVGYTVVHFKGQPFRGIAVCDLDSGHRTVASTTNPQLMAALMSEEFCGRRVQVHKNGELA